MNTGSNELDIEGFIASAGTHGMVANKSNYTKVWDAYERVYDKLKNNDARYPAPNTIRAITYEGEGNNNGVTIKRGCGKNPSEAGWGGQYTFSGDNKWVDGSGNSIKSSRDQYQNEFAERADWMVE